ncbi:hypothetical protein ACLKA6_010525 [Drosophila palustris]
MDGVFPMAIDLRNRGPYTPAPVSPFSSFEPSVYHTCAPDVDFDALTEEEETESVLDKCLECGNYDCATMMQAVSCKWRVASGQH